MERIVRIIWDFPLPYAPIRIRARSEDEATVLRRTSSKRLNADWVGMKFFSLISSLRSYPILTEYWNPVATEIISLIVLSPGWSYLLMLHSNNRHTPQRCVRNWSWWRLGQLCGWFWSHRVVNRVENIQHSDSVQIKYPANIFRGCEKFIQTDFSFALRLMLDNR